MKPKPRRTPTAAIPFIRLPRPVIFKPDPVIAAEANLICPILNLPAEIITSIVVRHLHPREAIFLSLTCHGLHHGVLSANNSFLWYKVGRFEKRLPGYKAEWSEFAKSAKAPEAPTAKKGKKRVAMWELASSGSPKKKPRSMPKSSRKELVNAVKHYSADETVVDYRRILLETMLGDAETGCQWCLGRPMTRKRYPNWGHIRLCEECLDNNVISAYLCKPLNIDISNLPTLDLSGQGGIIRGIWKPSVQRIVNSLAQTVTPEDNSTKHNNLIPLPVHPTLLPTTVDSILSAHNASRHKEANDLRKQHTDAIFSSIKQKYTEMHNAASATSFRGGDMWSRVMEKLPPGALEERWFVDYDVRLDTERHFPSDWKQYLATDPLMKILKKIKPGSKSRLYKDQSWVDSWADRKLVRMQEVFTYQSEPSMMLTKPLYEPWEVNVKYMVDYTRSTSEQWQLNRL